MNTGQYDDSDLERQIETINAFHQDFKALVRKYMPQYPTNDRDAGLLVEMQDRTSCYSPWIWS